MLPKYLYPIFEEVKTDLDYYDPKSLTWFSKTKPEFRLVFSKSINIIPAAKILSKITNYDILVSRFIVEGNVAMDFCDYEKMNELISALKKENINEFTIERQNVKSS